MDQLKATIRPEFLNRIDDVIVFHPLGKEHIRNIVDIQFEHVDRLLTNNQIKLSLSDNVKDWLAERGYDPVFGARPLKRIIQQNITNKLATLLISRDSEGPVHYEAILKGDEITFAEVLSDVKEWAEKE